MWHEQRLYLCHSLRWPLCSGKSRRECTETNAPAGSTDMASVRSTLDPNSKPDYTRYEDRKGDAKWGGLEYLGVTYPRPTNRKTCVALVAWFCPDSNPIFYGSLERLAGPLVGF